MRAAKVDGLNGRALTELDNAWHVAARHAPTR